MIRSRQRVARMVAVVEEEEEGTGSIYKMLSLCGNCEINSCGIVLAFTVDGEGGGEDPVAAAVQGWEVLLVAVVAAVAVAVVGRGGGEDEKSLEVLAGGIFLVLFCCDHRAQFQFV